MPRQSGQQGIDRLRLNRVRGSPLEPLVAWVFGHVDLDLAGQSGQEDHEGLELEFTPAASFADFVLVFEPKARVEFDGIGGDGGLFDHLSKGTLDIRFAGIDVPLRQIPAVLVPHQQEPLDRLTDNNQHTAGTNFGEGLGGRHGEIPDCCVWLTADR
jgi:hypothetical protein